MAITIKDIAKLAGVSHTTVSRAMNNSPLLKEETIKEIQQIAKEHGYSPNYTAKGLKLNKAFTYGLFFSTLDAMTTNSFLYETIQGVRALLPKGYKLSVEGIEELDGQYDLIQSNHYDGIIVISQMYTDESFIELIRERQIPMVVMNRLLKGNSTLSIGFDDEKGIEKAIDYLMTLNHDHIAFIGGKADFINSDRRLEGYKNGLKKHGMTYRSELVEKGEFTIQSGYKAARQLLKEAKMTAIVCANDEMAIGASKAIKELGLMVGQDVSLIGFDSSEMGAYLDPSLTSIKRSIYDMAYQATAKLNQLVEGTNVDHESIVLTTELIIRNSTKKCTREHKEKKICK